MRRILAMIVVASIVWVAPGASASSTAGADPAAQQCIASNFVEVGGIAGTTVSLASFATACSVPVSCPAEERCAAVGWFTVHGKGLVSGSVQAKRGGPLWSCFNVFSCSGSWGNEFSGRDTIECRLGNDIRAAAQITIDCMVIVEVLD